MMLKNKILTLMIVAFFISVNSAFAMDSPAEGDKKSPPIKFAVVGDFGTKSENAQKVAKLVKSLKPDFIITTGDNNYPKGNKDTIDENIGAHYSDYLCPYEGDYLSSTPATEHRFWPCLGNHDFGDEGDARPYFDYFPVLNNQFYYDFVRGPVHFVVLCSDKHRRHAFKAHDEQRHWVEEKLRQCASPWKILYYHHPTYSSPVRSPGGGGWPPTEVPENGERTIEPFAEELGVSVVFSGHHHLLEVNKVNGSVYATNGLGGDTSYYTFLDEKPTIKNDDGFTPARLVKEDGAMFVKATREKLSGKFKTTSGKSIVLFSLKKNLENRPF